MPLALILTTYVFALAIAAWASAVSGASGVLLLVMATAAGAAVIGALAWTVRERQRHPHEDVP